MHCAGETGQAAKRLGQGSAWESEHPPPDLSEALHCCLGEGLARLGQGSRPVQGQALGAAPSVPAGTLPANDRHTAIGLFQQFFRIISKYSARAIFGHT